MHKLCKIIIKDEINIKLEGLDVADRRHFNKQFTYEIPGARYMPAVKLGRWDGKASYFSIAGSTYINLLDEILPHLDERGYEIELEDHRTASAEFQFETVTETSYSHVLWPADHDLAGQPVLLRDYQTEVINNLLSNPQCIAEVATGAGKTIVTAVLSHCVQQYGRTVVIVPNKSLVVQTERDYRNLGLDVGVYFQERKEIGHTHTICTWQSLNNIYKQTKEDVADVPITEFIRDVVCVIVDECHSAKADALKSLMTQVFNHVPIRWGLTGTIPKDKFASVALLTGLGPVVHKLAAVELQDRGILANCHVNIIQLQDHVEFRAYPTELKYLLENSERLNEIASIIRNIASGGNTLILVDRITAGTELHTRLTNSVFISGETKLEERKSEFDDVSTTDDKIIIATYGVAAVGINVPRIFNLVLIEPGKSFVRVIQSIGRGIRRAHDKDHVNIYDITSNAKFSKRHLTDRKTFYREANYPFSVQKHNYR